MSELSNALQVAVIIPVKNRAELLRTTLNNILAQTLQPAEIIVVDDGSTDDLPAVANEFSAKVRFIPNVGQGPGAARNLGLANTTAPFVQFFDSDDLMTAGKLHAQAQALHATGADIAYGPYVKATELPDGGWHREDAIMQAKPLPSADLEKWLLRGWNAITQAMLFRRSFLERCPPWDDALITYEDYLYLSRLARQKPKLAHVPDEAVIYRQHGAQSTISSTQAMDRARSHTNVLETIGKETDWAGKSALDRLHFAGRYNLASAYTGSNQGSAQTNARLARLYYRLSNKFERLKTGTAWETMHGTDASAAAFAQILSRLT